MMRQRERQIDIKKRRLRGKGTPWDRLRAERDQDRETGMVTLRL